MIDAGTEIVADPAKRLSGTIGCPMRTRVTVERFGVVVTAAEIRRSKRRSPRTDVGASNRGMELQFCNTDVIGVEGAIVQD